MKEIPLTQGKVALVDDEDYDKLSIHKWCVRKESAGWYATRRGKNNTSLKMHRVILDAPQGVPVDHKDRNGLNNQRCNLRLANHSLNSANQKKPAGGTSRYKGVSWYKRDKKWMARADKFYLGYFLSEDEAARAYDAKARELFGEFALTNFPD